MGVCLHAHAGLETCIVCEVGGAVHAVGKVDGRHGRRREVSLVVLRHLHALHAGGSLTHGNAIGRKVDLWVAVGALAFVLCHQRLEGGLGSHLVVL